MATTAPTPPLGPRVVLDGVTGDDYEAMVRIVGNRPIRINYDSGRTEIMSPLWRHDKGPFILGRIVDTLVDESEIPYEGGDTVTFRRRALDKGIEPDRCFDFRDNAEGVRGKRGLDMAVDPPPDLVIEADLTSSSIPRLPIFAAPGIPEVWRLDDDDLQFLHLQPDGSYQPRDHSLNFPSFPLADAARFLELSQEMNKMAWVRAFRAFVRENYVPDHPA